MLIPSDMRPAVHCDLAAAKHVDFIVAKGFRPSIVLSGGYPGWYEELPGEGISETDKKRYRELRQAIFAQPGGRRAIAAELFRRDLVTGGSPLPKVGPSPQGVS